MGVSRFWLGAVVVGMVLACSGVSSVPPPPEPEAQGPPVDVPDRLTPYLPNTTRPVEVGTRDGAPFARFTDLSVAGLAAAWPSSVAVLERTESRMIGAYWDEGTQAFGILIADQTEGGLILRDLPTVPESGLAVGGCAEGRVELQAPWTSGTTARGCVTPGSPPRPVGRFKIEGDGIVRVEAEYGARGERTGTWTLRDDGGRTVSRGAFVDDRPEGRWVFGDEQIDDPDAALLADFPNRAGREGLGARSFAFLDGQTTDAPLAHLPVDSTDPHPYTEPALTLDDADLVAGWVHLTATYAGAPAVGRVPAICPPDGRGSRQLSLRPDRVEPAADLVLAALAFEGEGCTPPEAIAVATAAATEALAADVHPADAPPAELVGPPQRLSLAPGSRITVPLPLEGGSHTISWRVDGNPMGIERQLAEPDLLDGHWRSDDRTVVRRIELQLDQTPIDELWVRWPTACPDAVWIAGLVVQNRLVAPVYRTDPCDRGSRWVVGEVLALAPAEQGD